MAVGTTAATLAVVAAVRGGGRGPNHRGHRPRYSGGGDRAGTRSEAHRDACHVLPAVEVDVRWEQLCTEDLVPERVGEVHALERNLKVLRDVVIQRRVEVAITEHLLVQQAGVHVVGKPG